MRLIDDEETPIAYIENLEREVAELKERLHELIEELKADNERLRQALEDIATDAGGCCNSGYSAGFVARNALASTPALKGKL